VSIRSKKEKNMRAWRCLRENEPASIYNKSNNGYQDVEFEAKVGEFTCSIIIVLISALKAVRSVCFGSQRSTVVGLGASKCVQ